MRGFKFHVGQLGEHAFEIWNSTLLVQPSNEINQGAVGFDHPFAGFAFEARRDVPTSVEGEVPAEHNDPVVGEWRYIFLQRNVADDPELGMKG